MPPVTGQPKEETDRATNQRGATAPVGTQTKTAPPSPTAKAAEPQEPEPLPAKTEDGATEVGHAPAGQTTNKPLPATTERTNAAERKAKRPEKEDAGKEDALKTDAPGKAERTAKSTPVAQPVTTGP